MAQEIMSLLFASILQVYTIEPLIEGNVATRYSTTLVSCVPNSLCWYRRLKFSHKRSSVPEGLPYRFTLRNAAALAAVDEDSG